MGKTCRGKVSLRSPVTMTSFRVVLCVLALLGGAMAFSIDATTDATVHAQWACTFADCCWNNPAVNQNILYVPDANTDCENFVAYLNAAVASSDPSSCSVDGPSSYFTAGESMLVLVAQGFSDFTEVEALDIFSGLSLSRNEYAPSGYDSFALSTSTRA